MRVFDIFDGFDWDDGNKGKNWKTHEVSDTECEEVFFNVPIISGPDIKHSSVEYRYYLLGRTNQGRLLFVIFTPRRSNIRIISARDMTRKERRVYDEFQT